MNRSRRNFIKNAGVAAGAATLLGNLPFTVFSAEKGAPKSFGFQVWTIREELVNDFPGTLKKMADWGYKEVEMCSPLGYSDAGFEPLNHMSGKEMRKIVEDAGLKCTSSHYNMGELRESLDNRMEWAHGLGMKQMVASSFWLPKDASVDDYRKSCEELNKLGEKTKANGLQMVFHNHHMEFEKRGDELIYDEMLKVLDPDLVKMQFQVAVVDIGYKAEDYFSKYPNRFISAHLADYCPKEEKQVPIGKGMVDWKELFKSGKKAGIKNYYVEMDPVTFEPSADYLAGL